MPPPRRWFQVINKLYRVVQSDYPYRDKYVCEVEAERDGMCLFAGRRQRPQKPPPTGFSAVFEGSGISDHISPADITTLSVHDDIVYALT
jgi:hypothetical protein